MARQTRSQRRARREAQAASGGNGPVAQDEPSSSGSSAPPAKEKPVAELTTAEAPPGRSFPGSGLWRFVGESAAELKKVEWPTQSQLVTGTTVVLIACIIVGIFLYVNDQVWKYVVQKIVLK
jgi:preprotein translocase SecE subunit